MLGFFSIVLIYISLQIYRLPKIFIIADVMNIIFYRFSADPETSMGLVQHEGGPCGVLAAIQVIS